MSILDAVKTENLSLKESFEEVNERLISIIGTSSSKISKSMKNKG